MGKYDGWDRFFAELDGEVVRLGIGELETLTGVTLPPSARSHAAWWATGQPHARWVRQGWLASPQLASGEVVFRRGDAAGADETRGAGATALSSDSDLILLGCVASKGAMPAPAKDLYVSALWKKRRAYAESTGKPWMILSAEYGLLEPDAVIEPYDRYLPDQSAEYRRTWSDTTARAVISVARHLAAQTIEIHAGAVYIEHGLERSLLHAGFGVRRPLQHLRRGEQLAWYGQGSAPKVNKGPSSVRRPHGEAPSMVRVESAGPFEYR